MIRSEAEYQEAVNRLKQDREYLQGEEARWPYDGPVAR